MRVFITLLFVAASFSFCARAKGALYAATASGGPGELYILDPATGGVLQDIGPLNDSASVNYGITGLAFHPQTGVLYGSVANNISAIGAQLVTINPLTAQVTVIGHYNAGNSGNPATMADLAFDSAGNLYGVGSVGGPQLYSINTTTGQATVIGSTGITSTSGGGLAISASGIFYGTPTGTQFGTYNSTTGAFTNIASPARPAGGGAYAALSFKGNVLYGINSGPGSPPPIHLATIDTASGAVTDLGASLNSLDAIAFSVLIGDFNHDQSVDAADYVVWRKGLGTTFTPADYDAWRAHFGETAAGSGAALNAVPEPGLGLLFILTAVCIRLIHRNR